MTIRRIHGCGNQDDGRNPFTEPDRLAGWRKVLNDLENKVTDGEKYLAAAQEATDEDPEPPEMDFEPPTDLGPMPPDFELWARAILDRQNTLVENMRKTTNGMKKHADVAEEARMQTQSPALYIDLSM